VSKRAGARGATAAGISALLLLTAAEGRPEEGRVFHRAVSAADGVRLAMYRYAPMVPSPLPAVLLVPDFGMNRRVFDADGVVGLAPFLAAHGKDAFVLEPRGHGASDAPLGWGLGQVARLDVPAAVDAIQKVHPGPVDLVAYGYSGTLVMAETQGALSHRVRRVVALATPVAPELPGPTAGRILESGGRFADLAGSPSGFKELELLFFHRGAMGATSQHALAREGFNNLSDRAGRELVAWMKSGDFATEAGQSVRRRLAALDTPTYVLVGLADNWAHPEYVTPLRELAPAAKVRVRLLSKISLISEDYSHLSLVQGPLAAKEVFDPCLRFLSEP
jgi:pimeloyl-ACP methyl ester carboxylesterase